MKHPFNRRLLAYWNERRGSRAAPERADIDPAAMRDILGDSFVLALDAGQGHRFRIAGTRVCALFGRELRGVSFADLWDAESAPQIRDLTGVIAEDATGVVAGARAATAEGQHCDFEMLLLPLTHRGRLGLRMLGVIAAMERPYWLGIWSAGPLRLGVIQFVGSHALEMPVLKFGLPRSAEEKRRSFSFIPGGRT